MLAARSLSIRRDGRNILDRVDAAIAPGEVVGIIGPNGAGKSTLIAALAGELSPAEGAVVVDGLPIGRLEPDARARRLAVVPQATRLDFAFTARQVVELGRYPHRGRSTRPEDRRAVDAALAQADVAGLAGRDFTTLSGGEQQRCTLARALAQLDAATPGAAPGARYLLADEPTASLDISHQAACLSVMRALADRGAGVLCALHDLNLAALYVDRLIVVSAGRVVADAPPGEALAPALVRRVFQAEMLRIAHPARAGVPQFLGLGPAPAVCREDVRPAAAGRAGSPAPGPASTTGQPQLP